MRRVTCVGHASSICIQTLGGGWWGQKQRVRASPSHFGAPRYWGSGHKQASSICPDIGVWARYRGAHMSQVDTRPWGRARGLSVFRIPLDPIARAGPRPVSGHLQQGLTGPDSGSNQLQRKGLPRCWGTSSKVLNSYLSQSEGEGPPPVSGLRMCGTPTDW